MGQLNRNMDKVLEVFYAYPAQRFTVRELAKKTKIPKSTVQSYIKNLRKQGLISSENQVIESAMFCIKKINFYVEKIFASGLVEHLKENLTPSAIILFGSFRKGESVKESDIDLFVETSKPQKLDLSKFERKLGHRIQIFQEKEIHSLPDRLFNNVINGIVLHGFVKVK